MLLLVWFITLSERIEFGPKFITYNKNEEILFHLYRLMYTYLTLTMYHRDIL